MDMEVEMKTADLQEGSPSEHLDEVLPGIALPRHWILQFRQSCHHVLDQ